VNLLKSPLRRTTAALAGAFIGLAGAVAFAAPASAHYTELAGKTACLDDGGWSVDWTLTPKKAPIDGTIVKVDESASGSALKNIKEGATVPTGGTITDSQSFGKDVTEVTLTVKVIWVYEKSADAEAIAANLPAKGDNWKPGDDKKVIKYEVTATVKAPEDCKQPPAEQASPILKQDCDSMTIGLHNPENGEKIVLRLQPSVGDKRILVAKPGEDTTTTFEGVKPGFTVTVSIKGVEGSETVPYTQPKNCTTGGSAGGGEENGGGGESGGGLPVTGAAAGSIAGGAAVLLIAGGAMFALARRRKVKFTA
jgi:hypothetical protein